MEKKMISEKKAKELLIYLLVPVLVMVLSIFILARKVPEMNLIQSTLESVDESKTTVLEFTGATTVASLAISALPDDFATPIADNFAGMSKYFVIILMAIFVERLILTIGVKIAFAYVIPIACGMFVAGHFIKRETITIFSKKLAVLGLALVLVVPCSVKFTNYVGSEYLTYINETIDETKGGADKINDEMAGEKEDATIFEKLSDAFHTAVSGVKGLLDYFNNVIKKCINSIAILIVTNFVMPVATLFLFRWLLKEVFGIIIPTNRVRNFVRRDSVKGEAGLITEDKE